LMERSISGVHQGIVHPHPHQLLRNIYNVQGFAGFFLAIFLKG
jgi:hypothetical protein